MRVDAWIEVPYRDDERRCFVGDRECSPLALAVDAAVSSPIVARVIVSMSAWPEAEIGSMPVEWRDRVEFRDGPEIPDVDDRDVSVRLRRWAGTGSFHGILMTTEYCTHANPSRALRDLGSDGTVHVVVLSGRHAFATAEAVTRLTEFAHQAGEADPFYISDGPSGLTPALWSREAFEYMREHGTVLQALLTHRGRFWGSGLAHLPTEYIRCRRTFLLDTAKGISFVRQVATKLRAAGYATNPCTQRATRLTQAAVVEAAQVLPDAWRGEVPWDIEIEITTERPFDPTWLPKPRPPHRMSLGEFEALIEGLGSLASSVNLTFGGFGDPLFHPELPAMVELASKRMRGVSLRTYGVARNLDALRQAVRLPLDIITVRLGGYGAEVFAEMNGVDEFEAVWSGLLALRRDQIAPPVQVLPLLVAEVIKSQAGDRTVVDFMQDARANYLWPMVSPAATFGGAVSSRNATALYPGRRAGCLQLEEQMLVLADGSVPMCGQLPDGGAKASAFEQGLARLWNEPARRAACAAHREGRPQDADPRCLDCNQWHQLS